MAVVDRSARDAAYRAAHREERRAYQEVYRNSHSDETAAYQAQYYKTNRENIRAKQAAYSQSHKVEKRDYQNERYQTDLSFKLGQVLRIRVVKAIKNGQKSGSAVRDLGCSISELKIYLESKFQPGMTWDNYGEWHIDHIKPLAKFDLTDRNQFLKACHYTNLQPLWAAENLRKGSS